MEKKNAVLKNIVYYAGREAATGAVAPVVTGSIIQLFMAYRGVSSYEIGTFNTVLSLASLLLSMIYSSQADRQSNIVRTYNRHVYAAAICYLPYLILTLCLKGSEIFYAILVLGLIQTTITAFNGVLAYKMHYQIIPPENYGTVCGVVGVVTGGAGVLFNWICSELIDRMTGETPYLVAMILCQVLLVVAAVCGSHVRPMIQATCDTGRPVSQTKVTIWQLLRRREFSLFLVPCIMRGVSFGINGSITLIALQMGISTVDTARLAISMTAGSLIGSGVFAVMVPLIGVRAIGIIGGILMGIIVLMPSCSGMALLLVFFVATFGRTIVDQAVPAMVFGMIDPQISGAYNAWRNIITSLGSTLTVYVIGAIVETVNPMVLLVPFGVCGLIAIIWYSAFYPSIRQQRIENAVGRVV